MTIPILDLRKEQTGPGERIQVPLIKALEIVNGGKPIDRRGNARYPATTCLYCGGEYHPKVEGQKYCSHPCGCRAAARERRAKLWTH